MNHLSVAQNFFFKFFEKTLGGYYFFSLLSRLEIIGPEKARI